MDYKTFLSKVIEDGIAGVKRDYKRKSQKLIREGSIAGFEACREKNPVQLNELLEHSEKVSQEAMVGELKDYWYYRGFLLEVKWVCNVVSAMLMNQKLPTIIPPTARGVIQAGNIIGVTGK